VADLDARRFCRGYSNPLAMMGVALDRYLPERNAMLVNEAYVFSFNTQKVNQNLIKSFYYFITTSIDYCYIL
jgi:hypothetical protein